MGNETIRHGMASSGDMEPGSGLSVWEEFRRAVERRRILLFFAAILPKGYKFIEPRLEAERLLRLLPVERARAVAWELSDDEPLLAPIVDNISLVGVAGVARELATEWGGKYGRDKDSDPALAKFEEAEADYWGRLSEISEMACSIERGMGPALFS